MFSLKYKTIISTYHIFVDRNLDYAFLNSIHSKFDLEVIKRSILKDKRRILRKILLMETLLKSLKEE